MINKKLWTQVITASEACTHPLEEEGGLLLEKDGEYLFVAIKNIHAGSQTAISLYETDKLELRDKVFSKLGEGWLMSASFHTHPCFSATPSTTDMTYLFQGFKDNYVYAPKPKVFSVTSWEGDITKTTFVPLEKIKELLHK